MVGTHALFQDEVQFKNLALVIIDKPHPLSRATAPGLGPKKAWVGPMEPPPIESWTATANPPPTLGK